MKKTKLFPSDFITSFPAFFHSPLSFAFLRIKKEKLPPSVGPVVILMSINQNYIDRALWRFVSKHTMSKHTL